ncbi:MAG: hypothetical protein WAU54_02025, partial [Chania sp.]
MPAIFEKLDWPAAKKAQWLFEHLNQTEYDDFPTIGEHFSITDEVQNSLLTLCGDALEMMAAEFKSSERPIEIAFQMIRYA